MKRWLDVKKSDVLDVINKYTIIGMRLRSSRLKAKQLGIAEILLMNFDLGIIFLKNGPLGDVKGMVVFALPKEVFRTFKSRLAYVGYFEEFYLLDFDSPVSVNYTDILTINPLIWKGKYYALKYLYKQDKELYMKQSPHNRLFRLRRANGQIKNVYGYRGSGESMTKRALPVEDARCLVNLAMPFQIRKILDPFAGAGGIVFMSKFINPKIEVTSIDIDEELQPGLELYGAKHIVGDARKVKLEGEYDAIITEVPFWHRATKQIKEVFAKVYPRLNSSGMLVFMCAEYQSAELATYLDGKLYLLFNSKVNRKGTRVVVQVWTKSGYLVNELKETKQIIENVF